MLNDFSKFNNPKAPCNSFNAHLVSMYTVLCIMRQMKQTLGLEAMLEYFEEYVRVIDFVNPELKASVLRALRDVDMKKMYQDALGKSKPKVN